MVVEHNEEDNRNETDTGMNHSSVKNDYQPPMVEIYPELIDEREGMVLQYYKE